MFLEFEEQNYQLCALFDKSVQKGWDLVDGGV